MFCSPRQPIVSIDDYSFVDRLFLTGLEKKSLAIFDMLASVLHTCIYGIIIERLMREEIKRNRRGFCRICTNKRQKKTRERFCVRFGFVLRLDRLSLLFLVSRMFSRFLKHYTHRDFLHAACAHTHTHIHTKSKHLHIYT